MEDRRPKRENAYSTVKTSLRSILRDQRHREAFEEIVFRCNDIVVSSYQFIRLYCVHLFEQNQPLPTLDEHFIKYCIRAVGKRDRRGRKPADDELKTKLDAFYSNHFESVHEEKHDLRKLTHNIPYLATQIHTGIHNNLKEHFIRRLLRFVNLSVTESETELSKEEVRAEKIKGCVVCQ
jgi:hypothetical protein